MILAFTLACVAFGAVAVAYSSFPEAVRRRQSDAIVVAATGPALLATFTGAVPTNVAVWDTALVAGFVVAFAAAAAVANRFVVLSVAIAGVTLAGLGGTGLVAAATAVGAAGAVAGLGLRLPAAKALSGGLVALALLDLDWPDAVPSRLAIGAGLSAVLAAAALQRMSPHGRRRAVVGAAAIVVAGALVSAGAGWRALSARRDLQAAVDLTRDGLDAARDGDLDAATSTLARAERHFARARRRLDTWTAGAGLFVPGVAQNVRALRTIANAGEDLASASVDVAIDLEVGDLRMRHAAIDLDDLGVARRGLAEVNGILLESDAALTGVRSTVLAAPVGEAVEELTERVADASDATGRTLHVLRVLPDLLGEERPRRWFVGLLGVSEARASGGIIGSHGILTAANGRLTLGELERTALLNDRGMPERALVAPADYADRYGRYAPEHTWQNITMSPDGPSVGEVVEGVYPQSGGEPVDGVILVDHVGLAALLRLTGPVRVGGWPEPLTADTIASVLLHEQYLVYDRPERVDFLADAARGVFDEIAASELPPPDEIVDVLADAVAGRHLTLHSATRREQELFARLGVDGAMPRPTGDLVALVTQNASGNKIDWFLRRSVRYEARVDDEGEVDASMTVALANGAPSSGLPHYVIGGTGANPTRPGENRMIVSIYTPLALERAWHDGAPLAMRAERELGLNVYDATITVPPGATAVLELRLRGAVPLDDGRYVLDVRAQPTVEPDAVEVVVRDDHGAVLDESRWRADRDRRTVVATG